MKRNLLLFAVAAYSLAGSAAFAKEVITKAYFPYVSTPVLGEYLAPGATLINTATGGAVVYDLLANPIVVPPFDITQGYIQRNVDLNNRYSESISGLDAVLVSKGDTLTINFTDSTTLSPPVDSEYLVVTFDALGEDGGDFYDWYLENPVAITGKFGAGDYTAYVISNTSGELESATTNGGLLFFNRSVEATVRMAEQEWVVPEPSTATLSLLALAGLAARRRRRYPH